MCRVEVFRRLNYVYRSARSERRNLTKSRERARERIDGEKGTTDGPPIFTGEKIRDREDEQSPSFSLKVAAVEAAVIIGHGSITTAGIARD